MIDSEDSHYAAIGKGILGLYALFGLASSAITGGVRGYYAAKGTDIPITQIHRSCEHQLYGKNSFYALTGTMSVIGGIVGAVSEENKRVKRTITNAITFGTITATIYGCTYTLGYSYGCLEDMLI